SRRFFAQRGFEVHAVNEAAKAFEAKGQTVVLIGDDEHVCGLLALADTVRPEAAAALAALRALGIDHLIMLTGDNRATAEVIAGQVGIDEVHADLLPENKLAVVERLVTRHHFVGMVGDGVNDAPAMARASLGIAMGAAGSDAAIETADVALMTDELSRLPWLIGLSRRTLRVIHQNVAVSLVVKAGFVALTVAGVATLWGAIVADMGVSLLVVANGLRLLRAGDSL
ncbi:MAG: HAD-IC family P-type ATPase, partial [bacterium]|nr:HAD-IC family P-type ATPase [bacterium]